MYCFIHICCTQKGIDVIKDQIQLIKKTGFYDKLDKIYIGALGDYEKLCNHRIYKENNKIEICYFSRDMSEMEFPTLTLIKDFCDSIEKNTEILYIHTKGVRNPDSQYIEDWRKYMEYFLIEKHQRCIDDLSKYDTVGVNFHVKPWSHYSGNFWWSNSNHIKKLIHPSKLPRTGTKYTEGGRWNAEKWLLTYIRNEYKTNLIIISGFYGELDKHSVNVTDKLTNMVADNRLYIKKTVNINNIFGDPIDGVPKYLVINYKIGSKVLNCKIPEYKTKLKWDLLLDGNFEITKQCYHESGLHHYHNPYPRIKYTNDPLI
tara:strand:+ start:32 stop:979 length:948 start_codon:yes stop_codon:yes gene_type:complete